MKEKVAGKCVAAKQELTGRTWHGRFGLRAQAEAPSIITQTKNQNK
jgi:hypothetical protein